MWSDNKIDYLPDKSYILCCYSIASEITGVVFNPSPTFEYLIGYVIYNKNVSYTILDVKGKTFLVSEYNKKLKTDICKVITLSEIKNNKLNLHIQPGKLNIELGGDFSMRFIEWTGGI